MKRKQVRLRVTLLIMLTLSVSIASTHLRADTGTCGGQMITLPFQDVSSANFFFCSIAEAFFSGLTNGTTSTTYSPSDPVPREQMAAFVSRTLDQSLKRGHTRAALGQWWTNKTDQRDYTTTGYHNPRFLACDGYTVWVSNTEGNTVSRVDIKTGSLICTLSGIPSPEQIVINSGYVYVASFQSPGKVYIASIQQTTNGPISPIYMDLEPNPGGLTCDGRYLWTTNGGAGPGTGSISRIKMDTGSRATFTTGFSQPVGILFDGASLWVTEAADTSLKRVDTTTGAVVQTIALSGNVQHPIFDGTNLWIPCAGIAQLGVPDRVFVVRALGGLTGTVLAQLTGNGLNGAFAAAFDGERICVTNASDLSVSLWKASDLSPLGAVNIFSAGAPFNARGVCSDGITFFVGMRDPTGGSGYVVRF